MRQTLLATLLLFVALPLVRAGEAEKRVADWIARLKSDPPKKRRELMAEIDAEACPHKSHPPERMSDRTDLLPVLDAALANDDKAVRERAILALAYMKCEQAFPFLESALAKSDDETVRYYAVMGIEWLADVADLRSNAVTALGKARDKKDEAFDVKLHAASALLELGEKADAGIFLDALRDPKANEALAASALATLGRKDAVELLVKRLETAVPSSDHYLGLALEKLTGQIFKTDVKAWKAWLDANRSTLPEQAK